MPTLTGTDNGALLQMIEEFKQIVDGHNVDQEAVRAVIREHQAQNEDQ